MGVQFAGYDPTGAGAPLADKIVAALLHDGEGVGGAGYGDLLLPFRQRTRGKLIVSNRRLFFVPDAPVFAYPAWWRTWPTFKAMKIKGALWAARLEVQHVGSDGQMVPISLGLETTRALAKEIQHVWQANHLASTVADAAHADVLGDGKLLCHGCGFNPDDVSQCGACGRLLSWPGVLGKVVAASKSPADLLPATFHDGKDTQRAAIAESLATIALAAAVEGDDVFLSRMYLLIDAMRSRRSADPASFGDLPPLRRLKNLEDCRQIWAVACRYPERLAIPVIET